MDFLIAAGAILFLAAFAGTACPYFDGRQEHNHYTWAKMPAICWWFHKLGLRHAKQTNKKAEARVAEIP